MITKRSLGGHSTVLLYWREQEFRELCRVIMHANAISELPRHDRWPLCICVCTWVVKSCSTFSRHVNDASSSISNNMSISLLIKHVAATVQIADILTTPVAKPVSET